jgi:tetratricopeptide (TPR) repeat protein
LSAFEASDIGEAQILEMYKDALAADVLLLSGLQERWAEQALGSGDKRADALAILALSGDRQSLSVLRALDTSAWPTEHKRLASRAMAFLAARGRDTSPLALEQRKAAELRLYDLLCFPAGMAANIDGLVPSSTPEDVLAFLSRNRAVVVGRSLASMALYFLLAHVPGQQADGFWSDLLYKNKRYDASLDYAIAGEAAGPDASLENEIGNILTAKGDLSGANRHYEKSLTLGRNDGWPEVNMAQNYAELGDLTAAEKWFRSALNKRATARSLGEYAGYLNEFAWFIVTKRSKDAEKLREALALSEESNRLVKFSEANYLDTLAECQASIGEVALAAKTERQALALVTPGSEDATRYRERIAKFERRSR